MLAICPDRDVIGGAFYLMEFVDGYNPALGLRPPHDSDPAAQHDIGLSLVDAAAHLGQVDHVAIGLAGLSSGSGWLERQVDRWLRYADSYLGLTGYVPDPTRTERLGLLQDWLNASRPSECRLGLVHGDLQFAHVLVSFDTAQVAAVVDWELCTVGDPLLDLGHLLATWPRDPDLGGRLFGLAGLPSDQEVIARYQATSGTSLANLAWFRVLACFRLSIILEATFARSCAGLTKASLGTRLHRFSEILLNRGLALVTSSG